MLNEIVVRADINLIKIRSLIAPNCVTHRLKIKF